MLAKHLPQYRHAKGEVETEHPFHQDCLSTYRSQRNLQILLCGQRVVSIDNGLHNGLCLPFGEASITQTNDGLMCIHSADCSRLTHEPQRAYAKIRRGDLIEIPCLSAGEDVKLTHEPQLAYAKTRRGDLIEIPCLSAGEDVIACQ